MLKTSVTAFLLVAGLASCEMKDEIKGNNQEITSEIGYLDLGVAVKEKKSSRTDDEIAIPENPTVSPADFPVIIKHTEKEYTKTFESYEAMQAESPIALPVGQYTISAHTKGDILPVMDSPYYGGETNLSITKDVTSNAEVVCKMKNTKIQVVYDTEFTTSFKEWDITLTDGKSIVDFPYHPEQNQGGLNPKAKYLLVEENTKVIKIHIDAITLDGNKISEDRSIAKPEGEGSDFWEGSDALNITMKPQKPTEPGKPSGISGIEIKVEVSFSESEDIVEIPTEPGDGGGEGPTDPGEGGGENPETGAPTITIPQPVYELPADASKNAIAIIHAEAGIKSVKVQIVGGNDMFAGIIADMFGAEPFELIDNATLAPVFSEMGIPTPNVGDTEYDFPVGAFFKIIPAMGVTDKPDGHVFNIIVEDSKGKTATDKLSVKVTE